MQFQQRLAADLAVREPPAATFRMSCVPATAYCRAHIHPNKRPTTQLQCLKLWLQFLPWVTRGTPGCEFALPVTATHQGLPQSLTRQFQQRLEADLAVRDPPAATSPMSWVPATAALIEDWVDVIPADTELGPQPALYCCSLRPEAPAPDWAWAGLA